ncbi:hypothetical protein Tco_1049407, partial [Tanacetum coccineum]
MLVQNMLQDTRWAEIARCGWDFKPIIEVGSVLNQVIEMISCTNEGKPLALPWGQTSRLNFGVRVRNHVVRSRTPGGQRFRDIRVCGRRFLPRNCELIAKGPTNGLTTDGWSSCGFQGMSFSKRSDGSPVCYTKALDSLKYWNDHFFLVDAFACPTSFKWHTNKTVFRDPPPKPTEFSADAVAILVSHRAPFRKFPKPFLCLVGTSRNSTLDEDTYPRFLYDDDEEMDLFSFIHHADLTKVKIAERERAEGEMKLLESTIGRVVLLLLVPPRPARAESELEASVDELFDEDDNTEQGDSTVGGGHGAKIEPVTAVKDTVAENVTMERPKRQRKKRPTVTDASGPSYPPKKLREDHGTSSGIALGSKSSSILKELLSSSILNIEVGVTTTATLPLITSSISATPEREGGDTIDSITGPNVCTVGPAQRFVISSDYSHHSTTNAFGAEVDSIIRSDVLPLLVTEAVITSHAVSAPSILV